jgi:hypothetical protein
MYYGYYPYADWPSPWGPPMGIGYPMTGGFNYPYGGMSQMPYHLPPGGYGTPEMSPFGQPNYPPPGGFGGPGMSPFGPPMAPDQEINYLRDQAQMLKQQMDQIDARIKELEKAVKQIPFKTKRRVEHTEKS